MPSSRRPLLNHRLARNIAVCSQVSPIVEEVRIGGDEAVRRFTEKFDRVKLQEVCVRIEVSSEREGWAVLSVHGGCICMLHGGREREASGGSLHAEE